MRTIRIYEYAPGVKITGKRVIALGFFDGVHLGHREILRQAVAEAKRLSLPSAVFTFYSESEGLKGEKRIYPTADKISLIGECGIDEVILADFAEVKSLSAEDFIRKTLTDDLGCALALSGKDFRFGSRAAGDTSLLKETLTALGADLICPEDVKSDGEKISSSKVKSLLEEGNVRAAALLLGAPYFVKSEVKKGLGLGKTFGFPTVNTELSPTLTALPNGVYKCKVRTETSSFNALANVGTCPTVSDREKHMETYILGYDGNLYGEKITISFLDFIRSEKRFSSVEELKKQIKVDIITSFGNEE